MHRLIYQTLSTPDGLVFALFGPFEGRWHDMTLFKNSDWETFLQGRLSMADRKLNIFGDQVYLIRPWMMIPYPGNPDAEQRQLNAKMSRVRVSVEHMYKNLKQLLVS